jgi:hypothetical protein
MPPTGSFVRDQFGQDLDRHFTAEVIVGCPIHLAHPPNAE